MKLGSLLIIFPTRIHFIKSHKILTFSRAIKDASRGRASGRLVLLIKNKIKNVEMLDMSPYWLFDKLIANKECIIVGVVYFSPLKDLNILLELFGLWLQHIVNPFPISRIYVGGDFNACMGEINQWEDILFDFPYHKWRKSLLLKVYF